jgi:hypothetical protein
LSALIKIIFSVTGPSTLHDFAMACRSPQAEQEKLLLQYVTENTETSFGHDHDFKNIRSFAHFQKTVPIATYETLKSYVDRAFVGEQRQLTAESPVLFTTTSGTTGEPKYIPVTPASKRAKSQQMRVWLAGLFQDYPQISDHKVLTLVSPEVENYAPCGTPCGAESGHGYKNMSKAIKAMYSCPYEVYEISNYDARYYTILRIAATETLGMMYTANPSTILLLAQRLGTHTEDIIRDVRAGTLSSKYEIDPKIRTGIEAALKPDPARADFLEQAAAQADGVLIPRHVWPELQIICCWKGGNVGSYLDRFDDYFRPGLPVRDIGYFASEVRGSVVIDNESSSGVLGIHTNVYEFYPASREGKPSPTDLLTVDQLEKGKQYFVYVTTAGGLYRYEMNDIVEVTGYYENTPLIRFVQKGKGFVSFTGEKLYEAQVIEAVDEGLKSRGGRYEFITALGEMWEDKPRYIFLIEFDSPLSDDEGRDLLRRLEKGLKARNEEYETKSKSGRLHPAVLRVVKKGEFEQYRIREVANGRKDGQFKTVRLTSDASYASEFAYDRDVFLNG